ncbi:MAG TPA: SRPBCC domain-containing protein [Actinophytocola sp.]|uniref:SRPBCC domain-containing protein n=1 Tax=Actinophytocola sp. TaxID=1872138 RepID=UPI002DDD026B|nr:SRPBCC domain-containing protein [Actinophytocola sp.]HEV2784613.1 SRPBCC domain-containing protein [Actinophytocola sp.]
MYTIDTSIKVGAAPATVWEVIVHFAAYPEWNPFITRAEGTPVAGGVLTLEFHPPGGEVTTARPTVRVVEAGRRLRWRGTLALPWLFAAEHELALTADGDGTLVRHREEFTGLLVPLVRRRLRQAEAGFHEMNRALKQRAEGYVSRTGSESTP